MTTFNLPDLGEGLPDAEIRKWHVKEGDIVKNDEQLLSVETAKAVVEIPSPFHGKIIHLHGQPGDIIKTGNSLVDYESLSDKSETKKETRSVVGNIESSDQLLEEIDTKKEPLKKTSTIKAPPAIRTLAKKLNIKLSDITPSGKNGTITTKDIEAYSKVSQFPNKLELLRGVSRNMAINMSKSLMEVVPATIMEDVILPANYNTSNMTTKIIKSLIFAIKKEPCLNAWYENKTIGRRIFEDINLAIAIDAQEGLFVPVIKSIQKKSDIEIRNIIDKYKKSVKNRTIDPKDMQDATITLSNFGVFAGKYAIPIIVPPTVSIIGIGKIRDDIAPINQTPSIVKKIPLSLTFDHRAITGGEAARFVAAFIESMYT
jgi:pyruvate dehydrogenase E2 component (dihydrolipoamide acetyltransferase)